MGKRSSLTECLENGKKLQAALKAQKADKASSQASKSSGSKALRINDPAKLPAELPVPLDTEIVGVGITLERLMKREGISYGEALQVFYAYQDAVAADPGPSPKVKPSKEKKRSKLEDAEEEEGTNKKKNKASASSPSEVSRKRSKEAAKATSQDEPKKATPKQPVLIRSRALPEDTPKCRIRAKTPPSRPAESAEAAVGSSEDAWDEEWDDDMWEEWWKFRYGEDYPFEGMDEDDESEWSCKIIWLLKR